MPPIKERMDALLETPDAFRAWLASYPPDTNAGRPTSLDLCPVAAFVRASLHVPVCLVYGALLDVEAPRTSGLYPWVGAFVHACDKRYAPIGLVTTGQCLELLGGITG